VDFDDDEGIARLKAALELAARIAAHPDQIYWLERTLIMAEIAATQQQIADGMERLLRL
jgi:hypothetical protein